MGAIEPPKFQPLPAQVPRRAPVEVPNYCIPNTGELREDRGLTATVYKNDKNVQYVLG